MNKWTITLVLKKNTSFPAKMVKIAEHLPHCKKIRYSGFHGKKIGDAGFHGKKLRYSGFNGKKDKRYRFSDIPDFTVKS
jgi:hypothetical protein